MSIILSIIGHTRQKFNIIGHNLAPNIRYGMTSMSALDLPNSSGPNSSYLHLCIQELIVKNH